MTPDDELRAIADAATPGVWNIGWNWRKINEKMRVGYACGPERVGDSLSEIEPQIKADQEFMRTFDPECVLGLLDRIERMNTILDLAVDWLSNISSADGSGHADLARRITEMRQEAK